jgi:type IV pilus assembly protein PilC
MNFSYRAKLQNGEILEGVQSAADRFALAHELRSHGHIPLSITEQRNGLLSSLSGTSNVLSRVKIAEQIILTKNLSEMLKAGLSLYRALSVLEKQTKNTFLVGILQALSRDINSGETFSAGLAKFPDVFSKLFVSMVRAGEESGNLSGALKDVGENLEKAHSLTKKIKGALIYPGVILTAMVVIGILMFAFVVPTLASTFKELGVTLPVTTRVIIWLGTFFSNNLIVTFLGLLGLVFGLYSLLRANFMKKYVHFALIKLPIIGGLTKELNTARTARTMSSLLLSGVSIVRATEITEEVVQNVYYKNVLKEAKTAVEHGTPFSQVFKLHLDLYPIMMSEMAEVGEETGKLSDMLLEIALFFESEIENKTRNLSTIIEPILMLIIGGGVGFFAISMISPLYSVLNNIK